MPSPAPRGSVSGFGPTTLVFGYREQRPGSSRCRIGLGFGFLHPSQGRAPLASRIGFCAPRFRPAPRTSYGWTSLHISHQIQERAKHGFNCRFGKYLWRHHGCVRSASGTFWNVSLDRTCREPCERRTSCRSSRACGGEQLRCGGGKGSGREGKTPWVHEHAGPRLRTGPIRHESRGASFTEPGATTSTPSCGGPACSRR